MTKIPENIRLKELVIIANSNKPFFDDFISFLNSEDYINLYHFVREQETSKAKMALQKYLVRKIPDNQDLRNWHISSVRQISKICLFAGFMQSDAP